jgi:hypothetical protein
MMFVAFIFNAKGIFYFTYFVNVIGAIFASIFPDIKGDAFSLESIRYWYNHIYALSLPILGVALKVYERPTIKFMGKAIFWFTAYYLVVIFFNAWFSNYASVNYFFINEIIQSSRTAPPVATIICHKSPPPPMPSIPASQPPKAPPTIPIIMFHSNPLPEPLNILLPKNPATRAIKIE